MFKPLEIFRMAQTLATHAGARQAVVAENVANADTPGYKSRDLAPFAEEYRGTTDGFALRQTRAGHASQPSGSSNFRSITFNDAPQSPNGNSVSLEQEMVRAADITRQHDMALNIYRSALGIMRSSVGR